MSEEGAKPSRQDQAAAWFAAERAGVMLVEQRAEFDAWRADPRNQSALNAMYELWGDLAVLKAANPAAPKKVERPYAAIAAALLLVVVGGALAAAQLMRPAGTTIQTVAGQQRTQSTPDGSVIAVNVASAVSYTINDAERSVRLGDGEASFSVKPDKSRPFVVRVGDYRVRAVGTAFNVKQRNGAIQVGVSEGKVDICRVGAGGELIPLVSLGAGQLLQFPAAYSAATFATVPAVVPAEQVSEWRMRIVTYEDVPVRDVVEDFNRYFAQKLEVKEPALLEKRVTIRLKVDNREQAIDTLAGLLDVRVVRTEKGEELAE